MANDIDELFARIDEDPTLPQVGDIDKLIAYYRNLRVAKENGTYKKAKKDEGPTVKIDLEALGLKPAVAAPVVRRRI